MTHTNNKAIYELIAKKLAGQASEVELCALREMSESAGFHTDEISEIEKAWAQPINTFPSSELLGQKEKADELWTKSFNGTPLRTRKRIGISFVARIAASFIILFGLGALTYKLTQPDEEVRAEVTMITKQTPAGQKSTITLSDGTVVWLNSGSRLSFPSDFNDSLRSVYLEGQAYFEVFRNVNKPFKVHCRNLTVEALGTSFDINAYHDLPLQVSLLTGSVKVSEAATEGKDGQELLLKPGEFSRYNTSDQFVRKGKFDAKDLLAWKEGRIIFKNANIDVIISRLELWYGVKIENRSSIPHDKPFTGVFEQENLENILMNIGDVMDFQYIIKGNSVILKSSMPM